MPDDAAPNSTKQISELPPDRGYAWLIVFASFMIHVVVLGTVYSFGVFLGAFREAFPRSNLSTVTFVGSLTHALLTFTGTFAGHMIDRLGFRNPVIVGSAGGAAALILASFAQSVAALYLTFGVLLGLSSGLCFFPAITSVTTWFAVRRSTAIGCAVAGSGVGTFVCAALYQALISRFGWRVTLRLASVGFFFAFLCSFLLVRRVPPAKRAQVELKVLIRQRAFRHLLCMSLCMSYAYLIIYVFIVASARERNVSKANAAWLLSTLGIANVVGRVVSGRLADSTGVRRVLVRHDAV